MFVPEAVRECAQACRVRTSHAMPQFVSELMDINMLSILSHLKHAGVHRFCHNRSGATVTSTDSSINNQRLRTPQTQRPTHPHPPSRREPPCPTALQNHRIRVRRTTPNRHTRHRESFLLRQPRNRRLPRAEITITNPSTPHATIMHLPMRRKLNSEQRVPLRPN